MVVLLLLELELLVLLVLVLLALLLLLLLALLLFQMGRRHVPIAPERRFGDHRRRRLEGDVVVEMVVVVENRRLRAVSISDQRQRVVLLAF